jgi:hypothetical protein
MICQKLDTLRGVKERVTKVSYECVVCEMLSKCRAILSLALVQWFVGYSPIFRDTHNYTVDNVTA